MYMAVCVCVCIQDGKTGMELAKQKSSESQAHSKCFNALKDAAKTLVRPQTFASQPPLVYVHYTANKFRSNVVDRTARIV